MTKKLTNEELLEKSQVLTALSLASSLMHIPTNQEASKAIVKLTTELARDINGLTL
jgi:hypothetical protein